MRNDLRKNVGMEGRSWLFGGQGKEGRRSFRRMEKKYFSIFFIVNKYVILKLENFVIPFVKQLKYQRKMAD